MITSLNRILDPSAVHVSLPAPRCDVDPQSDDVELVIPLGQVSVTRGSIVRYACRDGYVLTQGQLVMACGHDGHFFGQLPVCEGKADKEKYTHTRAHARTHPPPHTHTDTHTQTHTHTLTQARPPAHTRTYIHTAFRCLEVGFCRDK